MNATARYPSHLISNSHSGLSNGSSMAVASMGLIRTGMGLAIAPDNCATAEFAEVAEEFNFFLLGADELALETGSRFAPALLFPLLFSAISAFSAANVFRLLSARATAAASHAAFTFPRPAGRLLVHSFDPASPAICFIVRSVRT